MTEPRLRMLVPLDGSPESESVLPALMPLFRTEKVKLTLLGVVAENGSPHDLDAYLTRLRTSLLLDGVPSESRIERGDPADEILWIAQTLRFDLVAMATHGRTGLRRALTGSVTEKVLRHSAIPVLTCRPGSKIGDWKRIVVALDGSPAAEAILTDATHLARTMQATMLLTRVKVSPPSPTYPPVPYFLPEEDPLPYLQETADRVGASGLLALPEPREGDPAAQIVRCARETGAGLICLTTHGRTGLSRLFMGSIAESVLRTAPCPVLLRRTVSAAIPKTSSVTSP